MQTSLAEPVPSKGDSHSATIEAVNQSANFNRSKQSDQDYAARVSNMELTISRVRETWK